MTHSIPVRHEKVSGLFRGNVIVVRGLHNGNRLIQIHALHNATVILIELRWHFSMPENRLK